MNESPYISVVVPVYGCSTMLRELYLRVKDALTPVTGFFELILIDDGSPDEAWEAIRELAAADPRVRGIRLSRNFGQHYAITAGLEACRGEWMVVMDCDLQDRPEEIPELLEKAKQGYEVVQARRLLRRDGYFKKLFSRGFYWLLSWLTGTRHDPAVANFGIYHRKVIDALCAMKEHIRYFPTMVKWVGFRSTTMDVTHSMRPGGHSTYNFHKLIRLALDIVLAYSDKPLRLTVKAGIFIALTGFLFALYIVIRALAGAYQVVGYASLIVSIWFLAGLVIFILGIVGLYVGKTFEGVKNRAVYIVRETTTQP
ncbi:MAG: glycosyltransferase family 2 protein [Bacteroidales bacterium]